tara:strand:- start:2188 stop:3426 length:1239 start_codon:yes stop_codon:yes gene_type:complete
MSKTKDTIFVQIASYRDPELVPTLDNLLENANNADNLHICIAFQYSEEDEFTNDINKYRKDDRFTIIDIPFRASKGACWARNLIQQHYKKEKYTLQLDSHHRFVKDWDKLCIQMLKGLQARGYKKPLLSSYIPSYNPKNDPDGRVKQPWGMSFDRFTPEGVVFFLPYYIDNSPLHPIPARYFSAHFCFTIGKHAVEVQHDPEYYFHGEEITLAVRSYTHGYDLFHPNTILAYHEYTRVGRTKQWDDDPTWGEKNTACHKKVRSLLGIDNENEIIEVEYGLGKKRTLKEYETYAGLKFEDRSITVACKDNKVPPGDEDAEYFMEFKHAIDLHPSQFPEDDYNFCAIIFEDKDGSQLFRQDLNDQEIKNHLVKSKKTNDHFTVWRTYSGPKPKEIIIWPHSESKGWGEKRNISI